MKPIVIKGEVADVSIIGRVVAAFNSVVARRALPLHVRSCTYVYAYGNFCLFVCLYVGQGFSLAAV